MISSIERSRAASLLPAVVLVGVALALVAILTQPASLDEAFVYALTQHGLGGVFRAWTRDPQALIPQLVAWPFGAADSLAWLRVPSLIAFAGAVVGTWWAARALVSPAVAVGAAGLVAVSPQALIAATDARWPAMALATTVVCWGLVLRADEGYGGRLWLWYAVALTIGIYCNALVVLMVPAHAVCVWLIARREMVRGLVAVIAAGVGTLPMVLAIRAADAPNPLVRLSVPQISEVPGFFAAMLAAGSPQRARQLVLVAAVVLVAAGVVAMSRRTRDRREALPLAVCAAWVVIPTACAFVISQLGSSVWEPRYLLGIVPGIAIAIAWAIDQLPGRSRTVTVCIVAVVACVLGARGATSDLGEPSEQWVAALARMHDGDTPVVFYEAEGVQAAGFYAPQFRQSDGDVVVPGWDEAAPPAFITLLDNPTFDRLTPGPPGVALVQRLLGRDGRVLLAIRPPSSPVPAVDWARNACTVHEERFTSQVLYEIRDCR